MDAAARRREQPGARLPVRAGAGPVRGAPCGRGPRRSATRSSRAAPRWRRRCSSACSPSSRRSSRLQEHSLVHALQWVAVGLGEQRPLALIVDDLHWADAPSLRFLAYLAARVHDLPVLVVAATRPREPGAENELLAQLAAAASVRALTPAPLSDSATASLVRDAGVARRAAPAFVDACFEVTGGNPLLLIELLRALAADGVEGAEADVARVRETGPEPVARSVRSTLARLGEAETGLARAVAILGDEADPLTAGRLAGLEPADAADAAALLEEAGLLDGGMLRPPAAASRRVRRHRFGGARRPSPPRGRPAAAPRRRRGLPPPPICSSRPGRARPGRSTSCARRRRPPPSAAGTRPPLRFLRRALAEPPPAEARADVLADVAFAAARAGDQDAPAALDAASRPRAAGAAARPPAARPGQGALPARRHGRRRGGGRPGLAEPATRTRPSAASSRRRGSPRRCGRTPGATPIDSGSPRSRATPPRSRAWAARDLLAGLAGMELVKGEDRERTLSLARAHGATARTCARGRATPRRSERWSRAAARRRARPRRSTCSTSSSPMPAARLAARLRDLAQRARHVPAPPRPAGGGRERPRGDARRAGRSAGTRPSRWPSSRSSTVLLEQDRVAAAEASSPTSATPRRSSAAGRCGASSTRRAAGSRMAPRPARGGARGVPGHRPPRARRARDEQPGGVPVAIGGGARATAARTRPRRPRPSSPRRSPTRAASARRARSPSPSAPRRSSRAARRAPRSPSRPRRSPPPGARRSRRRARASSTGRCCAPRASAPRPGGLRPGWSARSPAARTRSPSARARS